MKIFQTALLLALIFLTACSNDDDDNIDQNCTAAMLEEFEMVAYDGAYTECKSFLELYHFNNKQYYLLGNHCADITMTPVDCEGNSLCEDWGDSGCAGFMENARLKGIVGVQE